MTLHIKLLQLEEFLDFIELPRRGLIYAGAHVGEYIGSFLCLGFDTILAIEPNPEAFEHLRRLESQRIRCVQAAALDRDGESDYYSVPGIPTLNSVLRPRLEHFGADFGEALMTRAPEKLRTRCMRIDTMVRERAPQCNFDLLYMNIQGCEGLAIAGASETLKTVGFIIAETNLEERYHGAAAHHVLVDRLAGLGFDLSNLEVYQTMAANHGEAWFLRRDLRERAGTRIRQENEAYFLAQSPSRRELPSRESETR